MVFFKDFLQMIGLSDAFAFNYKIIDNQGEHYGVPIVTSDTISILAWLV